MLEFKSTPVGVVDPESMISNYADLMLGHCRHSQPQCQMFMPLRKFVSGDKCVFTINEKDFDCKPLQCRTSYAQMQSYLELLESRGRSLRFVWLHERFLSPVPESSDGLRTLHPTSADIVGLSPLSKDYPQPTCIFPHTIPKSQRKRKPKDVYVDISEMDPLEAQMHKTQDAVAKRALLVKKWLDHYQRLHLGLPSLEEERKAKAQANAAAAKKGGVAGAKRPNKKKGKAADQKAGDAPKYPGEAGGEHFEDVSDAVLSDSEVTNASTEAAMAWEDDFWEQDLDIPEPPPPSGAAALSPDALDVPAFDPSMLPGNYFEVTDDDLLPPPPLPPPFEDPPDLATLPPPPTPPPTPPGAEDDKGQQSRKIGTFGSHIINLVAPPGRANEVADAISIICNRHADSWHVRGNKGHTQCRRNLTIKYAADGTDDRDELLLFLKRWVLRGYAFKCHCPEVTRADVAAPDVDRCVARTKHMEVKVRKLTTNPPSYVLDRLVADGYFTADELSCLRD